MDPHEVSILLLGDAEVGKSTFLSYVQYPSSSIRILSRCKASLACIRHAFLSVTNNESHSS